MAAEPATKKFALRCSIAGHEKDVRALTPLYFPEGSFVSGSRDVTAKVWQPNEGDNGFSEGLVFGGHNNFISAVCVIPPSDQYPHGIILTGSNDHLILAYTLDSPEPKYRLTGHEDTVCALSAGRFGAVVSGSWDKTARVWLGEKCVMSLQGHTAAVWSVAIMPQGGYMLTGSADKLIKLWKTGNCERTFTGHEDCVRGLAVLNPQEFLSCSNDSSVRRWLLNGDCVGVYYGHTNYVYGIACLPNGLNFVSCGEDRTLRVWENGILVQTIAHPAQSVWTVCALPNGDIVTGASDGVVRVFTRNPSLVASVAELAAFEECVAGSAIPAQVGDIKTEDLPGPEALLGPGKRDGQTLMVRRRDNIEAYQWVASEDRWQKIGDVVGGSGGSQGTSGKVQYEGKEYDFVFDVDLGEGMPVLKLPYNLMEDPWAAAHNFLEKNEMSQLFLDQVAQFIQQQTAGITLGAAPSGPVVSDPFTGGGRYIPGATGSGQSTGQWGDPFTGGNRYVPTTDQPQGQQMSTLSSDPFTGGSRYQPGGVTESSQAKTSYFPETSYIKYDNINLQGVLGKLNEFNLQAGGSSQFSEADLKQVEKLVTEGESTVTAQQLDILWRLMRWPVGVLFPILDILRHTIRYPAINQHFCNARDGPQFISFSSALLSPDGQPKNHLLVLRMLCNAFQHSEGETILLSNADCMLNSLTKLIGTADKNTQVALSSLVLNFVIGFRKLGNIEGKTHCLLVIHELCRANLDTEAVFRLLVSVGTAVANDNNCLEMARSLNLMEIVALGRGSGLQKVRDCAETLSKMLM